MVPIKFYYKKFSLVNILKVFFLLWLIYILYRDNFGVYLFSFLLSGEAWWLTILAAIVGICTIGQWFIEWIYRLFFPLVFEIIDNQKFVFHWFFRKQIIYFEDLSSIGSFRRWKYANMYIAFILKEESRNKYFFTSIWSIDRSWKTIKCIKVPLFLLQWSAYNIYKEFLRVSWLPEENTPAIENFYKLVMDKNK